MYLNSLTVMYKETVCSKFCFVTVSSNSVLTKTIVKCKSEGSENMKGKQ